MLSEGSCQKVHVLIKKNECNAKNSYTPFKASIEDILEIRQFVVLAVFVEKIDVQGKSISSPRYLDADFKFCKNTNN